jgi:FixJ family two-component response regulator
VVGVLAVPLSCQNGFCGKYSFTSSWVANGRTYQEIAQTMFVSVNTVKSHLKSIYGKLSVHNRREAVAQARVLHLIKSFRQ